MRRHLLCEAPEGQDWRDRACIDRSCVHCGVNESFKDRMKFTDHEWRVLQNQIVSVEIWTTGDKDKGEKDDFVRTPTPFPEFFKLMGTYFNEKYVQHHEQSVWQDHDWSSQCRHANVENILDGEPKE